MLNKKEPKPRNYWNLERCQKSAAKYQTRVEWAKANSSAHAIAYRKGWMSSCSAHMIPKKKPQGYWTLDTCKAEALKYLHKVEWQKNHASSYGSARKKGWLSECSAHMIELQKPNGYWNLERCKAQALNYKSVSKWQVGHPSSYDAAVKNKWKQLCTAHMVRLQKPANYWNLERCKEQALQYKSRSEWDVKHVSSYTAARRNNWVDICAEHMLHNKFQGLPEQHRTIISQLRNACPELKNVDYRIIYQELLNDRSEET